jgi:Meckel syndrome type 1 protein
VATQPDPYRTLGLSPDATADEIRRAYRRLAKANHPDSAGEKALPRFLAIQAAYESLVGVHGGLGPRRPGTRPTTVRQTARETWRADPERARTARESRAAGPDGTSAGRRRRPSSDEPRRPGSGRKRPSNKATPGSTTYDAAEDEPFEPEWSGGTWYGASSGTYWTLNPKEYADPRKHGPEYQRRARRGTGDQAQVGETGPDPIDGPAAAPETAAWERWPDEKPAGPEEAASSSTSSDRTWARPAGSGEAADQRPGDQDASAGLAAAGLAAAGGLLGAHGGFANRVGLAVLGWPPIGVAISTIAGEVTGCGRFAATCIETFELGTWLAQLVVIVILLALPSLAALSAVGTLAALAASVPTAVILSASGGSREPGASAAILGGILALAYLAGVAFALVRRGQGRRVP